MLLFSVSFSSFIVIQDMQLPAHEQPESPQSRLHRQTNAGILSISIFELFCYFYLVVVSLSEESTSIL
jgi:hypothetical protein